MSIKYGPGMHLELWVQDRGVIEGYSIFINNQVIDDVSDGKVHIEAFPPPIAAMVIAVRFSGVDGGTSAIVDNQGPGARKIVAKQEGIGHVYEIVP